MTTAPDIDTVSALLAEVARDIVLPRFRRLASGDIERKHSPTDPDDIVTIVDHEVEAALERALPGLVPGSTVIGEEATHADASVLNRLDDDTPVWVLDPIDGTRNFVAGNEGFGIMLGHVVGGRTTCAWILFPARNELFVAEAGSGAFLNGVRLVVPLASRDESPRGVMHVRYMPSALEAKVARASAGKFRPAHDARAAAVEYTDILRGTRDFAVYYRLLPWDHAAPGLILDEGGGLSVHLDGSRYVPRSPDQVTIVAGQKATADRIRAWFANDLD